MAKEKAEYVLTPEHEAQLPGWADLWVKRIMSTEDMDLKEREICVDAVDRLYKAANLTPPPRHRIIFVPSPFVVRFAAGFAALVWYCRRNDQYKSQLKEYLVDEITGNETPTELATKLACREEPLNGDVQWVPPPKPQAADAKLDLSQWYVVPEDIKSVAKRLGVGKLGVQCAQKAYRFWQGGNQWGQYDSFLSFFRHIAKLDLDYSKWDPWEQLAIHSGPRAVHADFCIISNRPEKFVVDEQNRPHCPDDSYCRWRDQTRIHAVHGVRIPAWVIERPNELTADKILKETNQEVARVMMDRFGVGRYIQDVGAEEVHRDDFGILYRIPMGQGDPVMTVKVVNATREPDGTYKDYWLKVDGTLRPLPRANWPLEKQQEWFGRQQPQTLTARNAVASTFGFRGEEYHPAVET